MKYEIIAFSLYVSNCRLQTHLLTFKSNYWQFPTGFVITTFSTSII